MTLLILKVTTVFSFHKEGKWLGGHLLLKGNGIAIFRLSDVVTVLSWRPHSGSNFLLPSC